MLTCGGSQLVLQSLPASISQVLFPFISAKLQPLLFSSGPERKTLKASLSSPDVNCPELWSPQAV